MKKYFFIGALFLAFSGKALCQYTEEHRIDSLKIDSMRSILPSLKDSARIDCLNSLSEKWYSFYTSYNSPDFKTRTDSIYKYASLAYKEATQINYKYGMAIALINMVWSFRAKGPKDSTYNKAQTDSALMKFKQQALSLAKEIQNDELLGKVYYAFGDPEKIEIENFKQAIYHYQKAGDLKMELEVTTYLVWELMGYGNYDEAIQYCEKCIQRSKKIIPSNSWEHELVEDALVNMGAIYEAGGDYETAMDYYRQADRYVKKFGGWELDFTFCELYYQMGQYDSALHYWQNWKKNYATYYFGAQANGNTLVGQIYVKTGQYDKAIEMFNLSLNAFKKGEKYDSVFAPGLDRPLISMGEAYAGMNNYKTALLYAKQGLGFATISNDRSTMVDGYKFVSETYHHMENNDSAYFYLDKYIVLKDSVENKQFLWRLNNYKRVAEDEKKEAKLLLLNKDNQIKDQQLKQESLIRNFLFAGLFVLLVAGIFIYRTVTLKRKNEKLQREQLENEFKVQQLENEKRQAEFQQLAAELEMQALRAQMNPHFIFNCLSSINRIILKNDSKAASDYLTRFSRLIRMVLINSQKSMIPLEEELDMLRLYLDMERLRFKDSFDYTIATTNTVDAGAIDVPPLLLQPFCENAVWHGLMHKEGHGQLSIEISMQGNTLQCIITDDGIGRVKAAELKNNSAGKEKSLGLKITTQRLALFNRDKNVQTFYTVEDIMDENNNAAGTKVILKIGYKELKEEFIS